MMTKLENFLNLLHERFQYIVDDNAGNNNGWNDEDEMCHWKDISGLDEVKPSPRAKTNELRTGCVLIGRPDQYLHAREF